LAAGTFLPRLWWQIFLPPNVTDQKIFFLKENDLEKGWYVIFMQIILACKNARKKPVWSLPLSSAENRAIPHNPNL
jgi:hypothetical protein